MMTRNRSKKLKKDLDISNEIATFMVLKVL